jgi:hypothetical protein
LRSLSTGPAGADRTSRNIAMREAFADQNIADIPPVNDQHAA